VISRALSFVLGLVVAKLLHDRDDFEDRLEALEQEADARAERRPVPRYDADGRERSPFN